MPTNKNAQLRYQILDRCFSDFKRKKIIENQSIESLLHLSRSVFGADFGASSAVIKNTNNANACGTYFRLVERTFQKFEQSHLRMLFEQTLANHEFKFNFKEDGIDQYKELVPNSRFEIDDDGIIPLMASNIEFTDAVTKRFKTWLTVTFGEEAFVENLNYIEKCLGKTLDAYFVKDF